MQQPSSAASAAPAAAAAALSSEQLEQLSASLQSSSAKHTGTLIMDQQGTILASSGDLKDLGDRVARWLLTLLQDTNGILVHSDPAAAAPAAQAQAQTAAAAAAEKEELVKMTISFQTYAYAISMTHQLILCVKSNLE